MGVMMRKTTWCSDYTASWRQNLCSLTASFGNLCYSQILCSLIHIWWLDRIQVKTVLPWGMVGGHIVRTRSSQKFKSKIPKGQLAGDVQTEHYKRWDASNSYITLNGVKFAFFFCFKFCNYHKQKQCVCHEGNQGKIKIRKWKRPMKASS